MDCKLSLTLQYFAPFKFPFLIFVLCEIEEGHCLFVVVVVWYVWFYHVLPPFSSLFGLEPSFYLIIFLTFGLNLFILFGKRYIFICWYTQQTFLPSLNIAVWWWFLTDKQYLSLSCWCVSPLMIISLSFLTLQQTFHYITVVYSA